MSGHYFEQRPEVRSEPRRIPLALPDIAFDLDVDRGVFSADRVDPGTKILLSEAGEPVEESVVLDLGCGYGPIACALATRAPTADVWAIDVNERARTLCAANALRLGLRRVRVASPDEVPDHIGFDLIVSNPPIRIGKAALHDLLSSWLGRLNRSGHAELVVHRNLGSDSLARWLEDQGWPVKRLVSRSGYRVLRCSARQP